MTHEAVWFNTICWCLCGAQVDLLMGEHYHECPTCQANRIESVLRKRAERNVLNSMLVDILERN